mmetsp:Transcript_137510/g.439389  ORF Transcript_137510/g.439389 Transcript_137510/m.439389 type:complete len:284 (+) Transcript_137510:787-1638(+)
MRTVVKDGPLHSRGGAPRRRLAAAATAAEIPRCRLACNQELPCAKRAVLECLGPFGVGRAASTRQLAAQVARCISILDLRPGLHRDHDCGDGLHGGRDARSDIPRSGLPQGRHGRRDRCAGGGSGAQRRRRAHRRPSQRAHARGPARRGRALRPRRREKGRGRWQRAPGCPGGGLQCLHLGLRPAATAGCRRGGGGGGAAEGHPGGLDSHSDDALLPPPPRRLGCRGPGFVGPVAPLHLYGLLGRRHRRAEHGGHLEPGTAGSLAVPRGQARAASVLRRQRAI